MAWNYASPEGSAPQVGGSVGPADFWTYRSLRGIIQMRPTDIERATGTSWQYASMHVQLLDSNGVVHASGTMGKQWGVTPGYTHLGTLSVWRSLRFRISISTQPGGYAGLWSYFQSSLRWDPNIF